MTTITAAQALAIGRCIEEGTINRWAGVTIEATNLHEGTTIAVILDKKRTLLISQSGQCQVWPPSAARAKGGQSA